MLLCKYFAYVCEFGGSKIDLTTLPSIKLAVDWHRHTQYDGWHMGRGTKRACLKINETWSHPTVKKQADIYFILYSIQQNLVIYL